MAMKISYFFSLQTGRNTGWSENFWNQAGDFATAYTAASALQQYLAAVHGRETLSLGWRMAKLDDSRHVSRLSQLVEPATPPTFNGAINASNSSDYPTTSLLLKSDSGDGRKVQQWIKGIPDSFSQVAGVLDTSNAANMARINALLAHLNTSGNGWKARLMPINPNRVVVVAFDAVLGIFTVPVGHGINANDIIRVHAMRGDDASWVNKTWKVRQSNNTSISLNGWNGPETGQYLILGAYIIKENYELVQMTWSAPRITARQVGGPFAKVSGRRTTRR